MTDRPSTRDAVAGLVGALERWACALCNGTKTVPKWRYVIGAGSDLVPCRTCNGDGLHPLARAALATWRARVPLGEDDELQDEFGDWLHMANLDVALFGSPAQEVAPAPTLDRVRAEAFAEEQPEPRQPSAAEEIQNSGGGASTTREGSGSLRKPR